ncbi:TIGR01621 family pseudouridine synthase [Catenovulum sp. SM1970]|uniref:TIGR01621 family pseudouridine synthase n=1 Tax=Marinifaba aquimaris TaxID=2741323 RepID=UPI001573A7C7|nr:TIGR01621 family pseudouridine synthase [Marinifaba aquimaris]NTS76089.1 TIGR01621 family pseudouridine synthase [Marinifaba aquimaris]
MSLIFENEDFIVCNKPHNVDFHDNNGQIGFFNQMKTRLNQKELYPVHRLDKVTSGLLIMAKNLAAEQNFNKLFVKHDIEKYYLAIAEKGKKKQGTIKGDMAKSRNSSFKLLKTNHNPATTQFFSYGIAPKQRLYLLRPLSGKTHQLRVALKSLGSPIYGDELYKGQSADRVYLHAYALKFSLGQKNFEFKQPPAPSTLFDEAVLAKISNELSEPWYLSWPKTK